MATTRTSEPARSAADWQDAALSAIAAHGLRSLSIPELARTLGVTKGSFYWHFRGIGELVAAALQRWEQMDEETLAEISRVRDPRQRLTALFVQAMERREAHALYVALSGSSDADVAACLARINERRLRFLARAYQDLGLGRAGAREQALLAYTAYVGALHLRRQGAPGLAAENELARYIAHAVKTLI